VSSLLTYARAFTYIAGEPLDVVHFSETMTWVRFFRTQHISLIGKDPEGWGSKASLKRHVHAAFHRQTRTHSSP